MLPVRDYSGSQVPLQRQCDRNKLSMDINMIKKGLHIIKALSSVIQTFPRSSTCSRSLIFSTHGANDYVIIVEVVRAFLKRILSTIANSMW